MKLQEQEREIKAQQRKIQELTFTLAIQDAHTQNIKASGSIPLTPSPPPLTTETPGPHRLQLKPERPEDIAYRAKLEKQKSAEKAMGQYKSPESPEAVLAAFQALLTVFKGKGRTQTGQSLHTLSDRKPKEPCSYGVGANHPARTCYQRQNDENNDKNLTHKQANLNIKIDEQGSYNEGKDTNGNQKRKDFIQWYDSQLNTMAELKTCK